MPLLDHQPQVLTRDPDRANRATPLDPYLRGRDPDFTFHHALTVCEPGRPVVGQLPARLTLPWDALETLADAVNPPDAHWNDVERHVRDHYQTYRPHYDRAFVRIVDRLEALHAQVQAVSPDDPDDARAYRAWLTDLREQHAEDGAFGYVEFPYLALQLHANLRLLLDVLSTVPPALQREFDRFRWFLAYPLSDENSYSLNLTYPVALPDAAGRDFTFVLLFAYRLGRCQVYRSAARGDRLAVYLGREVRIPSVHETMNREIVDLSRAAHGLLCELTFT